MHKNELAWRGQPPKAAIAWAAILFSFGLWNSAAWPQAVSQDPAVERGRKQFQQSCGFCHGPDATGARGPDLVRSPLVAHDVKGDKIGEVIRLGRPDKGMPPMPMTDCHSPTGDLAAIATKFSPIELETRMLYPGGRSGRPIITAVVSLPSGEQIQGPLVHADDFVVGLRDASGWYRSFSRNRVKVELRDPLTAHRELLDKLTQADVHNLFAYLQTLK